MKIDEENENWRKHITFKFSKLQHNGQQIYIIYENINNDLPKNIREKAKKTLKNTEDTKDLQI